MNQPRNTEEELIAANPWYVVQYAGGFPKEI